MENYDDAFFQNNNKEDIIKQMAKLRKNIKKKHRSIKQGIMETEEMWEKQLAPISEPLKKLVEDGDKQILGGRKRKIVSNYEKTPMKRYALPIHQGKERNPAHNATFADESTSDHEYDDVLGDLHVRRKLSVPSDDETDINEADEVQEAASTENPVDPRVQLLIEKEYTSQPSGQELLKTPEGKNFARKYVEKEFTGRFAKEYFLKLIKGGVNIDHTYGVRVEGDSWMLGDKPLEIDVDDLIINGKHYKGTRGLYELIFMNIPNEYVYSGEDLDDYATILQETNAHRAGYLPAGKVKSSRGKKYKNIISKIMSRQTVNKDYMETYTGQINQEHAGKGLFLSDDQANIIYWNDPNELVDRLKLILASQQAGNTSHNNEINSILEELHELDREMLKTDGVSIVDK